MPCFCAKVGVKIKIKLVTTSSDPGSSIQFSKLFLVSLKQELGEGAEHIMKLKRNKRKNYTF